MELFVISEEYSAMLLRFMICLLVNSFIIYRLYYRKSHRLDFSFTFMIMTIAIFFLVYFMMSMERGKATMGVGLGLFGIFSIMRYRTDTMPVREMTYLFVIICLAVIHAMAGVGEDPLTDDAMTMLTISAFLQLIIVDIIVVVAVWLCEKYMKFEASKLIQYDRIELIKPECRDELIADLENRLGLKVNKVEVGGVDFLRDMTVIKVFYESDKGANSVDGMVKVPKMK